MQAGVEVLDVAPPKRAFSARWLLRALIIPALIFVVSWALYAYHKTAIEWESAAAGPMVGDAPPLYATFMEPDWVQLKGPRGMVPILLVAAWLVVIIVQAERKFLPFWLFPIFAAGFAFSINITVAMMDGPGSEFAPFYRTELEYMGDVYDVRDDPGKFIREYPVLNPSLTIHPGTHPPGGVLFLYYVSKWFDPSVQTASYAAMLFTSLSIIPAYFFALRVFGAKAAAIAAGLYAVSPGLVLFGATSMDGVFTFFPLLGVWLLHEALARKKLYLAFIFAVLAGIALTMAMFMTFATLCIAIIYIIYALITPKKEFPRVLLILSITLVTFLLCNVLMYLTISYDPIACLFAAIERDARAVGTGFETFNRYLDISLANLMAFLICAGAAGVAAFAASVGRHRLATAFAIGIVVIAFSTLFTLETERIWIFMAPLLLAPAAWRLSESRFWPYAIIALTFAQTWRMEAMLYTHW